MLKTVIVDDENDAIETLNYMISRHCRQLQIVATAQSVQEAITTIQTTQPDIVFLDIQLKERSGFEVLQAFPQRSFEVIFVTAYDKYAVRAFKFSAIDYLLKPVESDELISAVDKVYSNINQYKHAFHDYNVLIENLRTNVPNKLAISGEEGIQYVDIHNIIQIQGEDNYARVIVEKDDIILVAKTLKHFEQQLADYDFYRIHKSNLINLSHVKKYNRIKGCVELTNGQRIPLPRRKKEEFLQLMEKQ